VVSERIFRLGFMSEMVAALFFLLAAWALYVLLKQVNRSLALLFVLLNLCGVAIECVSAEIRFAALPLLTSADYGKTLSTEQAQALATMLLNVGSIGGMVSVLFYGVWLFPLGYLVIKSRLIPRAFGALLIADGLCLLICFVQLWLFPGHEKLTYPLYPVMFIAECGLGLWLVIKGVKEAPPEAGSLA
jgi:hypothetical protein